MVEGTLIIGIIAVVIVVYFIFRWFKGGFRRFKGIVNQSPEEEKEILRGRKEGRKERIRIKEGKKQLRKKERALAYEREKGKMSAQKEFKDKEEFRKRTAGASDRFNEEMRKGF